MIATEDKMILALLDDAVTNPDDPTPLLVLADYLDEDGDAAAGGVRWAVKNDKRPHKWCNGSYNWMWKRDDGIDYSETANPDTTFCVLSLDIYHRLEYEKEYQILRCDRDYDTCRDAWLAFLDAWRKLVEDGEELPS